MAHAKDDGPWALEQEHRRIVDGPQGCTLCLLGIVRRAYQRAWTYGLALARVTTSNESIGGGWPGRRWMPHPGHHNLSQQRATSS
jgi:hypothetical protein